MAANRYAEMVRWMAWRPDKNSRSSAQPGTHPHDGVQATVTPAPDAEPPPGSGQNTGISGTRHAVADNPQDYDSPAPAAPRAVRRRRRIRSAPRPEPQDAAPPVAPEATAPAAAPEFTAPEASALEATA